MQSRYRSFAKTTVMLLIAGLFGGLLALSVPHVSAQTDNDVTYTELTDITDGKVHLKGNIQGISAKTRSIHLVGYDQERTIPLCGQHVHIGNSVISSDTASTGNFDLVCTDGAEFLPNYFYMLLVTEQEQADIQNFTYIALPDAPLDGTRSYRIEESLDLANFDPEPFDATTWKFEIDSAVSGYSYVTLNAFGTVSTNTKYLPIITSPFSGSEVSGSMDLYSSLGTRYNEFGLFQPSLVLVFSDSGFNNFGIYQIENPEIDYSTHTITVGQVTNEDLITSTDEFIARYLTDNTPQSSGLINDVFGSYFQDWETWYVFRKAPEEDWIEAAYDNFISAPVDITEVKGINRDFVTQVVIPTNNLMRQMDGISGAYPNEVGTILSAGEGAFQVAQGNMGGDLASLRSGFAQLFTDKTSVSNRMKQALYSGGTAFWHNFFVETAYAQSQGGTGRIDSDDMDDLPDDLPNTAKNAANGTPPGGGGEGGFWETVKSKAQGVGKFVYDYGTPMGSGKRALKSVANIFGGIAGVLITLLNTLLTIFLQLTLFLLAIVLWLFAFILQLGETHKIVGDPVIVQIWGIIRNFANILFIILFLWIAVANIVQYQIDNYQIKKILPKVIFALIFINFSKLYVEIILRFADLLEMGVYSIASVGPHGIGRGGTTCPNMGALLDGVPLIGTVLGNIEAFLLSLGPGMNEGSLVCKFAAVLQVDTWPALAVNNGSGLDFGLAAATFLIMQIAAWIVFIMTIFGFVSLAVIFLMRVIMLWVLTVLSPLYFAAKPIPMLENMANKWNENFWKHAFMHVQLAFFLTIAVMILNGQQDIVNAYQENLIVVGGFGMNDILKLATFLILVYYAVFSAVKSDHVSFITDKINSFGRSQVALPLSGIIPLSAKLDRTKYNKDGKKVLDEKGDVVKIGRLRAIAESINPGNKRRFQGFVTARSAGAGAVHLWKNVVQKPADARKARDADRYAGAGLNFLKAISENKVVNKMMLPVWKESLKMAEYYDRAGTAAGQEERASEIKKGLQFARVDELREGLREAAHHQDEDSVRAHAQMLAERGVFDIKQAALDMNIITDPTRRKELEKDGTYLNPEEYRQLENEFANYTHEKFFLADLEQKTMGNYDSGTKQGQAFAAANASRLNSAIVEELMKGEYADPIRLGSLVRYGYTAGKGGQDGIMGAMHYARNKGKMTNSMLNWFSNISELNLKFPFLEALTDPDVVSGDVKFVTEDGEFKTHDEIMDQLIAEAQSKVGPDGDWIGELQGDSRYQMHLSQLAEHSMYVKTRVGKTTSTSSGKQNFDPDHGASTFRRMAIDDAIKMARTGSNGEPPLKMEAYINTQAGMIAEIETQMKIYKSLEKAIKKPGFSALSAADQKKFKDRLTKEEEAVKTSVKRLLATFQTLNDVDKANDLFGANKVVHSDRDNDALSPNLGLSYGKIRSVIKSINSKFGSDFQYETDGKEKSVTKLDLTSDLAKIESVLKAMRSESEYNEVMSKMQDI